MVAMTADTANANRHRQRETSSAVMGVGSSMPPAVTRTSSEVGYVAFEDSMTPTTWAKALMTPPEVDEEDEDEERRGEVAVVFIDTAAGMERRMLCTGEPVVKSLTPTALLVLMLLLLLLLLLMWRWKWTGEKVGNLSSASRLSCDAVDNALR